MAIFLSYPDIEVAEVHIGHNVCTFAEPIKCIYVLFPLVKNKTQYPHTKQNFASDSGIPNEIVPYPFFHIFKPAIAGISPW